MEDTSMSRVRLAAIGLVAMVGFVAASMPLARAQDGSAQPPSPPPGSVVVTATDGAAHVAAGAVHTAGNVAGQAVHTAGSVAGQAVHFAGSVAKSTMQFTTNILNTIF
jgi:hypothetical protein